MSFFFVLSGFVAMHSNRYVDFSCMEARVGFVRKRVSKVYPTYLIWCLVDVPGCIVSGWAVASQCWLFWLALASQPFHPVLEWDGFGLKYDSTRVAGPVFCKEVEVIGFDNHKSPVHADVGAAYVKVLP
jgi:hypothetical protein